MKIVFKPQNVEDKECLIEALASSEYICPEDLGMKKRKCDISCVACWEKALEEAEKTVNGTDAVRNLRQKKVDLCL